MAKMDIKELLQDKLNEPTEDMIKFCVGDTAYELMTQLEVLLNERYDIKQELRFWDSWQKGFWHKKVWLFDIIYKENGLTITMTITDKRVSHMEEIQLSLQPSLQKIWKNRKKFGPSSWPLTFEIETKEDINDLIKMLAAKTPPQKPINK